MSKISEQKVLEAYPIAKEEPSSFINQETLNSSRRTGYIVGYDQALQDFLEKARTWLFSNLYRFLINSKEISIDEISRNFKDYIQEGKA